ncbi:DUF6492 family protein [Roseomonas sp. KE2513]|uniref:DUF6492 family protein n=1 Tax=Roseomonas sp. KE2513 TaxID=2479202 RepID=UPI0018E00EA5|nr:DUF6492 family protein [Roseomonas sp. KE2513]
MEGVLPLKVGLKAVKVANIKNDHRDYSYNVHDLARARMLIYSIEQFWIEEQSFHLHVICPDNEIEQTSRALRSHKKNLTLNFIPETFVVPELTDYENVSGWYKQQVIKLAAHKVVRSDWYLTLDSDIFACKNFNHQSFFSGGKLVNDWEPRTMHPVWWDLSAKLLGIPAHLDAEGMKPTPVAISTEICKRLHDFLQSVYSNRGWRPLLENLGWTEFSLYNAFMDLQNIGSDYHCTSQQVRGGGLAIRSPHSFSTEDGFKKWDPKLANKATAPGLFMICNSISRVHPEAVWNKLQSMFSDSPDYSYFST